MKLSVAAALLSLAGLTSCASIVDGSSQSLSVETISNGNSVPQASCELSSNKGTWFVNTPGSVTVHRGYDALNVKCTKDGYQDGIATVKSSTKAMAAGNLLFGGVIGAGVDMGTGAAYDYPNLVQVPMNPAASAPVAAVPAVKS